jgi:hypothetical protein
MCGVTYPFLSKKNGNRHQYETYVLAQVFRQSTKQSGRKGLTEKQEAASPFETALLFTGLTGCSR